MRAPIYLCSRSPSAVCVSGNLASKKDLPPLGQCARLTISSRVMVPPESNYYSERLKSERLIPALEVLEIKRAGPFIALLGIPRSSDYSPYAVAKT